ncbi:hypothetical protein QYE76_027890 [Lolium multiflorum]|uniref:KIB1-4 beta-propeller domain-containing protein n=1 Tax=Lolium multiflorum TaxID=4521 RepID=A0AAD8VE08_LOLMU|nr:hypothetical protein QYE76_027890 [Lolium multiflorum]
MATPLPTHNQVPIPVDASFAGDTEASAAGFPTVLPLPLVDQATTHSISCMTEAEQFVPWSELRPELVGLVLKRLPSLADRVRMRAVCHPWRNGTMSQALPLPFPWLTLPNGTFLSIPGGEVHQIPVPDGSSCHGSIDSSLFLMSSDGAFSLLNPFSKTTFELPNLVTTWQREIDDHTTHLADVPVSYKLVAPTPLGSSPKSLAAALIIGSGYAENLCIIKPQVATYPFRLSADPYPLVDFAFFDGRLHMVSEFFKLFIVDFSENLENNPNISCAIDSVGDFLGAPQYLDPKGFYQLKQYLVESGGKLLMVQRFMSSSFRNTNVQTVGFKVLEADMRTNPGQWRMVSDLGGHALFLGKQSSKSLPAGEGCGSHEDCIYFICDYPCRESSANPLRDSGIYSMRNGTFRPLYSGTPAVPERQAGQWGLTWFFPPEAV